MQTKEGESTQSQTRRMDMESLRLNCEKEISLDQQRMESFASSFLRSLDSVKAKAQETIQIQGEELKVKSRLKEAEDELVKALAVKTRKEAKRMAVLDEISAVKARVEQLQRIELDQKAKRDEYSAIITQQSRALASLEEKTEQESRKRVENQEAISWYNKILGLRIEGGSGVKFTFDNIDAKRPDKLYSFTIRHTNEVYSLLECDPPLDRIKELMHELNKSNDLYMFVRIMRRKFVEATEQGGGSLHQMLDLPQVSATIVASAPLASYSSDKGESSATKSGDDLQYREDNRNVSSGPKGS